MRLNVKVSTVFELMMSNFIDNKRKWNSLVVISKQNIYFLSKSMFLDSMSLIYFEARDLSSGRHYGFLVTYFQTCLSTFTSNIF